MTWTLIIVSCIAIVSTIAMLRYRKQIRTWNENLSFILSNQSNMLMEKSIHTKNVTLLCEQLNEQIRRHRSLSVEYEARDESFKQLITSLSHDIRTPLTSLDGYFQLLADTTDEKIRKRYTEIIQGRINQLMEMLDQLFVYMKLQNNCYELQLEECNLNQILCDCMLGFYEQFNSRGMEPEILLPEEEIILLGNHTALNRVLQNIIKNALEHGEEDFSITLEKEKEIVITCKNAYRSGDEIDFSMIFERFYKADKARSQTSTGLGLAIAKELTEKLGGTVSAENQERNFILQVSFPLDLKTEDKTIYE